MKILNILIGLFYIIGDLIKKFFSILIGSVALFFTSNRKNNEFLKLMTMNCWLVPFALMTLSIWVMGHISVLIAIVISFIFSFVFSNRREQAYNNYHGDSYEGGYDVFGVFASLAFMAALLIVSNSQTAYKYDKIGTATLVKSDLVYNKTKTDEKGNKSTSEHKHTYKKMVINGIEISVSINGCSEGEVKIFEETLPITYFPGTAYINSDYVAGCSSSKKNYKEIKGINHEL